MSLDVNGLASKTWNQFIEKPVEHVVAGVVVTILSVVSLGLLMGPLTVGWIRMCDKQRRGESIQIGDVFSGFDTFVSSLGALILVGIGVTIGFALLVLPGIALMFAWSFCFGFIALKGQGAIESLGSSYRLFRAQMGPVVTVLLLIVVVSVVGGASVILSLVTTPLATIFMTLAFQELSATA